MSWRPSSKPQGYDAPVTAPHEPPPPPPPTVPRGLAGPGEVDRGPTSPTGSPGAPVRNRFPLPLLIFLLSIVVAVVGLAAVWRQPGLPGASTPSASAIDTPSPSARTLSSPTDSPSSGVVPSLLGQAALARAIVSAVEVQVFADEVDGQPRALVTMTREGPIHGAVGG